MFHADNKIAIELRVFIPAVAQLSNKTVSGLNLNTELLNCKFKI